MRITEPDAPLDAQHRVRPELHQLAIFLKVAETGSFAATARLLGVSQPAISQTIARLEDVYGGDLFERRRGADLALTPVGEAILPSARAVIDAVDEQMQRASETAQSHSGTLTVGFHTGLAGRPLRAAIGSFVAESPGVSLHLVEGGCADLLTRLDHGRIDLMIATAASIVTNNAVASEPLWDEQLFVALPNCGELVGLKPVDASTLASSTIIMSALPYETKEIGDLLDRLLVNKPAYRYHAVSRERLLDLVGLGLGITFVFGSTVTPHSDICFRPLAGKDTSVPVKALWRANDGNPLRHNLLRHIREHVESPARRAISGQHPPMAP